MESGYEADLVKDMLSLITVFSAKLYVQRSKKNRKKKTETKFDQQGK